MKSNNILFWFIIFLSSPPGLYSKFSTNGKYSNDRVSNNAKSDEDVNQLPLEENSAAVYENYRPRHKYYKYKTGTGHLPMLHRAYRSVPESDRDTDSKDPQCAVMYKNSVPVGILQPVEGSYRFLPVKRESTMVDINPMPIKAKPSIMDVLYPSEINEDYEDVEAVQQDKRAVESKAGFSDERYPYIFAKFKIDSRLEKNSNPDLNMKRSMYKRESEKKSISEDKVGFLKSTLSKMKSDDSVAVEEELKNILDEMGLIDDSDNKEVKRELEDENLEVGTNKITMMKEERSEKRNKRDNPSTNKIVAKSAKQAFSNKKSKKHVSVQQEPAEEGEAVDLMNTDVAKVEDDDETDNGDIELSEVSSEKSAEDEESGTREKRQDGGKTAVENKEPRKKRDQIDTKREVKAASTNGPSFANLAELSNYENRVEREIREKIQKLRDEVKKEIAILKQGGTKKATEDSKRKKRQVVNTLMDGETPDIDPKFNLDGIVRNHIRRKRKAGFEETSRREEKIAMPNNDDLKPSRQTNITTDARLQNNTSDYKIALLTTTRIPMISDENETLATNSANGNVNLLQQTGEKVLATLKNANGNPKILTSSMKFTSDMYENTNRPSAILAFNKTPRNENKIEILHSLVDNTIQTKKTPTVEINILNIVKQKISEKKSTVNGRSVRNIMEANLQIPTTDKSIINSSARIKRFIGINPILEENHNETTTKIPNQMKQLNLGKTNKGISSGVTQEKGKFVRIEGQELSRTNRSIINIRKKRELTEDLDENVYQDDESEFNEDSPSEYQDLSPVAAVANNNENQADAGAAEKSHVSNNGKHCNCGKDDRDCKCENQPNQQTFGEEYSDFFVESPKRFQKKSIKQCSCNKNDPTCKCGKQQVSDMESKKQYIEYDDPTAVDKNSDFNEKDSSDEFESDQIAGANRFIRKKKENAPVANMDNLFQMSNEVKKSSNLGDSLNLAFDSIPSYHRSSRQKKHYITPRERVEYNDVQPNEAEENSVPLSQLQSNPMINREHKESDLSPMEDIYEKENLPKEKKSVHVSRDFLDDFESEPKVNPNRYVRQRKSNMENSIADLANDDQLGLVEEEYDNYDASDTNLVKREAKSRKLSNSQPFQNGEYFVDLHPDIYKITSDSRKKRENFDELVAIHGGGPARSHLVAIRQRSMLPHSRFRRRVRSSDTNSEPRQLIDMSEEDIFGALPQSYEGELARFKRVKRAMVKK